MLDRLSDTRPKSANTLRFRYYTPEEQIREAQIALREAGIDETHIWTMPGVDCFEDAYETAYKLGAAGDQS